ncbi:MAG TPA: transcription-repair coupling factor, partial [Pusillimonas sp.]|nr:transcription-repair coupling factor [Pusillimonas sp.]
LHQLRGRVGRSHHQAYAYLLTPGEDAITSNAKKRLEAIQAMEELGSGFFLAMHDLEIRGTGEVLGESQSGNIQEVGFAMYSDMLNTAVKALKNGEEPDLESPFDNKCEVNLHAPTLLPADYCPDVHARLGLYKKMAHATCAEDLTSIQEELIDRYGKLPDAARTLLASHQLRLIAEPLGITKIDAGEAQALIQFSAKPNVDPVKIIELVQSQRHVKLAGQDKLKITMKPVEKNTSAEPIETRITALRSILKALE